MGRHYSDDIFQMPVRILGGPVFVRCPIIAGIPNMVRHSRIPGIPGIRMIRHSVPVPGMEVVGTL
jgi:hypothetical protein